jgi:hypothetical protein
VRMWNRMPEKQEAVFSLPLFDEAVQAIKEKGGYQRELTAQELASIMSGIVIGLTQGQETVKVSVPAMTVEIEKARGTVWGTVKVESPFQATIIVNCALENDAVPNRIKLARLDVQEEAEFAAKLILKLVNIEGKAKKVLRDPNQALGEALASQLEPRGVRLTGIGWHFNDQTLAVNLRGEPASPKQ